MSFLPGMFPAGALASGRAPASMVFNGADEWLSRTLITSGASTTSFTYSVWVKTTAYVSSYSRIFDVVSALGANSFIYFSIFNGVIHSLESQQSVGGIVNVSRTKTSGNNPTGQWTHFVLRYDSTLGTAADRYRIYRNGTLATGDTGSPIDPAFNGAHQLFANARIHLIGRRNDSVSALLFNGKLAFINVLDGVSQDPAAFAFDNGGVWTAKKYAGAYGIHGFALDGSGLGVDASGNGQHFTGNNMDNSNLDVADLPPFVG